MKIKRKGILGSHAFKISIFYVLIGGGWILFSDTFMDMVLHKHNMVLIIVLKGILYTGITAYLLFTMIYQYDLSIKRSRESLQLEERKFSELFENANDAIFLFELQSDYSPTTFIEVNRVACEQLGYTRNDLLSMSPRDIIEDSYLKKNIKLINKSLEGGSIIMESSHVTKKGHLIPCELSLRVFTFGGKKVGFSIVRYIAERKRAEEILRESEAKYRLIADNMSDLIRLLDVDGVVLYASPSHETVLGYSPKDIEGKSAFRFMHAEDVFNIKQRYFTMVKTKVRSKVEYQYRHADGHWVFIEAKGTPVFDDDGNVEKVVIVARDITERKQMEKTLRDSEAKYRLIADNMSDIIGVLDVNGTVLYASPSHDAVLGFSPKDYEGISALHFVHADDESGVRQRFITMLITKVPTRIDFRYLHADGHWVIVDAQVTPVLDEHSKVEKVVVVARDITERKQSEEQLLRSEKLAVVGELAAGVAHEIRNPLTSIKGFLQLLSRNEENASYCSIILSEMDRINGIVSEFLMIAKPQAQNLKSLRIQELVHDVIALLDTHAVLNNVQITCECDSRLSSVIGDENQLKQVFINILKNAIDAMPNGGGISVEARLYDEKKIMIRVIDRGYGIPKERLSRIGEPFYTTKEKGTGLGLMVSKRIMEAHHGEIQIMSEEGVGTIVDLVLPAQIV